METVVNIVSWVRDQAQSLWRFFYSFPADGIKDIVCVATSGNLMLPVAPVILKQFLDKIKTQEKDIVKQNFGKSEIASLSDEDLSRIGIAATNIQHAKKKCDEYKLDWPALDALFALFGIVLLCSGLYKFFGFLCVLLFVPPVFAICVPVLKYWFLKHHLDSAIQKAKKKVSKKTVAKSRKEKIDNYVANLRRASMPSAKPGCRGINENSNGIPTTDVQ